MESVDYLLSCQSAMYKCDADFIGSSGWSLRCEKTGVVLDGCIRRLEVTDSWRSCGGGCLCIHT